jgi:hypothetical protein
MTFTIKAPDAAATIDSDITLSNHVSNDSNSKTITFETTDVQIGSEYQGGVVFYLDGQGHGLVVAYSDAKYYQDDEIAWSCNNINLGASNQDMVQWSEEDGWTGGGLANTEAYVGNSCYFQGESAAFARQHFNDQDKDQNNGGYNDWFIPSTDELKEMYDNLSTLNAVADFDDLSIEYWSSTEISATQAQSVNLAFYATVTDRDKGWEFNVRLIRAFGD